MGVRQDVKLQYKAGGEVVIYSHWNEAEVLKGIIKDVLRRRERWDDESYLARMIFSAIVKDDIDSATGYGLAPYGMGEETPVIINFSKQTVDGVPFEEFII